MPPCRSTVVRTLDGGSSVERDGHHGDACVRSVDGCRGRSSPIARRRPPGPSYGARPGGGCVRAGLRDDRTGLLARSPVSLERRGTATRFGRSTRARRVAAIRSSCASSGRCSPSRHFPAGSDPERRWRSLRGERSRRGRTRSSSSRKWTGGESGSGCPIRYRWGTDTPALAMTSLAGRCWCGGERS